MSLQVIPLTTSPNQSLTVQLTVDGSPLTLNITVEYDQMAGYWILGISDVNNNLLIDSVPMITGSYPAGNLLEQQRYLGIGSWYVVNVSNLIPDSVNSGGVDYPDNTNLGTDFQLWVDDTPSI